MKKFLIGSILAAISLLHSPVHADFQSTFIANPKVSAADVEELIIEHVQRSFVEKNIQEGRFIYEETPESEQDHTRYIYVLPGTMFNERNYVERNFSKVPLSARNRIFIKRYLRQLLTDTAHETNYLGAACKPAAITAIVALSIAAALSEADSKHRHNKSDCHKNDTYLDTRRALEDHDNAKALAQENADPNKMLILDEKLSVKFSNNHINRLKSVFKNSAKISHFISSLGIGLVAGLFTGALVNKRTDNTDTAFGYGVLSTVVSTIITGLTLEYTANKVNKKFVNEELEQLV